MNQLGPGVPPAAWQGWAVLFVFVSALTAGLFMISTPQYLLAYLVGITVALIAVVGGTQHYVIL